MEFRLENWAAWAPAELADSSDTFDWLAWAQSAGTVNDLSGEAKPALKWVPAMLKRRMSRLSRMALQAAYECSPEKTGIRTVFCSRHGEIHRTVKILESMVQKEGVSPTAFSLSVHNSASGLYSIAREDKAPASAIAAGKNTFLAGLFEALGYIFQGEEKVLLIIADEPLPDHYSDFVDEPEAAYAVAFLIAKAEKEDEISDKPIFSFIREGIDTSMPSLMPQALLALQYFLREEKSIILGDDSAGWRLDRLS